MTLNTSELSLVSHIGLSHDNRYVVYYWCYCVSYLRLGEAVASPTTPCYNTLPCLILLLFTYAEEMLRNTCQFINSAGVFAWILMGVFYAIFRLLAFLTLFSWVLEIKTYILSPPAIFQTHNFTHAYRVIFFHIWFLYFFNILYNTLLYYLDFAESSWYLLII